MIKERLKVAGAIISHNNTQLIINCDNNPKYLEDSLIISTFIDLWLFTYVLIS